MAHAFQFLWSQNEFRLFSRHAASMCVCVCVCVRVYMYECVRPTYLGFCDHGTYPSRVFSHRTASMRVYMCVCVWIFMSYVTCMRLKVCWCIYASAICAYICVRIMSARMHATKRNSSYTKQRERASVCAYTHAYIHAWMQQRTELSKSEGQRASVRVYTCTHACMICIYAGQIMHAYMPVKARATRIFPYMITCMYVRMLYVYIYIHIYIYNVPCVCMYVCIYINYVCMHVCIYRIYVCMYVCTYV
jgi:hypothetical protein